MCETHLVEERERRRGREVERRKAEMRKHDSLDTNSEASSYTEEEESLLEEGAKGGKGDCWLIKLMLHCASMSLMRMFNICSQPVCITPMKADKLFCGFTRKFVEPNLSLSKAK